MACWSLGVRNSKARGTDSEVYSDPIFMVKYGVWKGLGAQFELYSGKLAAFNLLFK